MFAPCLLGCPGTTRYKPSADGTPPRRRISCQRASVKLLVDCVNRTPEQRTLNPRVRGSSPWRRTRDDLGFYRSRSLFLILCGAALRPAWGREMFEMPAHPAVLCLSEASFAYGHDDNRRSACARRCGSVRLAFSCLGQRRACRVRPGVRFTSEGWSSQAGAAPAVRAADLPGRMRPRPLRLPGLAASGVRGCEPPAPPEHRSLTSHHDHLPPSPGQSC